MEKIAFFGFSSQTNAVADNKIMIICEPVFAQSHWLLETAILNCVYFTRLKYNFLIRFRLVFNETVPNPTPSGEKNTEQRNTRTENWGSTLVRYNLFAYKLNAFLSSEVVSEVQFVNQDRKAPRFFRILPRLRNVFFVFYVGCF